IRDVAAARVPLTVAQQNVAELEQSYYENLAVTPSLGPEHPVTWAVRKNAPELQRALNQWIIDNRDSERSRGLYTKYFVDRRGYRERVVSRYLTAETGTLSAWDELLRRNAPTVGWD